MIKFRRCLLVCLLLALAACGGNTTSEISTSPPPPPPTASPDVRADYLLKQMTQAEKVQLVHGGATYLYQPLPKGAGGWVPAIPRLGIPDIFYEDGSVGVSGGVGQATALPSSIASAAAWDTDLAYQYGRVIGQDMRALGMTVNLGGNINLVGREPRDGRTFETKGEDPILAGKITAAHVKAIQDQYVVGGLKHFSFNDQETGRTQANVLIDERSGRESDLLAFEIGIKDSNAQSVMCSYNLVNGIYACENPYLLTTVLKNDWAFPGFVMSDWWATHSTAPAANAGLDQEQPNQTYFRDLAQTVASGQVTQSRLDNMAHRILRALYASGVMDHPASIHPVDVAAGDAVAQQAEEQGAVLLKNDGTLPLNAAGLASIAVIGWHADLGVLSGGGSAQVNPNGGAALTEGFPCPPCWSQVIWDPSPPLAAIRAMVPAANVQYNDGTDAASAAALAVSSNVAIVFVSQWTSEGMDIPSLNFTDVIHSAPVDQDALVAAVAAANPRTIVVMENGGAQAIPWANQVAAVLEAWFPGERGGPAIANLLFGVVNPSGKLPLTFPASASDLPRPVIDAPPDSTSIFNVDYTIDGLNVGYKWFDAKNMTPAFPFGFGLSYTTFSITNPQLANNLSAGNPNFQVTFTLTNTGSATGAEVAQVYLGLPAGLNEPPRRLVGWKKVKLSSGQAQSVTIEVDQNDSSHPLSYWDVTSHSWKVAGGDYTVYLGNSSRNFTTVGTLHVGP